MGKELNKRKIYENPYLYVLSIIVVLVLYFVCVCFELEDLDFVAINGTFQNYNFIRRFLDGQVPFVDFPVYLGSGHLIVTSFFTFLFGNDYSASVHAYHYVSSLTVIMYFYVFGYAYFKKNWIIPFFFSVISRLFLSSVFSYLIYGGNSARAIRALIVPVIICVYLLVSNILRAKIKDKNKVFISHIVLVSLLAGLALVWSNDYGLVSFIALFMLVFAYVLIGYKSIRKLLVSLLIMIAGSLSSAFILVLLITRGHPVMWVRSNCMSSQYQGWYYEQPQLHTLYYYQIDLSLPLIICFILLVVYFYFSVRKISWEKIQSFGLITFTLLSCFGACQAYKLFSLNTIDYPSFLISTFLILAIYEAIRLVKFTFKKGDVKLSDKTLRIISIVSSVLIIICILSYSVVSFVKLKKEDRSSKKYFPELGGYLDENADDLDKALEITAGRKVFSAYASALEVATDQYQPTGYDYIIHVLTDEGREQYLSVFEKKDFDLVSTIRKDYKTYGTWIFYANWFFYREVYSQYHYVGSNTYADYWEPGIDPESIYTGGIKVVTQRNSDNELVVVVVTEDPTICGVADVYLDYSSDVKEGSSSFLLHQIIVGVTDDTVTDGRINQWTLRQSNKEYIPITVVDGMGYVILDSYPEKITKIEVNEASCDRIFVEVLPKTDD